MSAPTVERTRRGAARTGTRTAARAGTGRRPIATVPAQRAPSRSAATDRAYARRDGRRRTGTGRDRLTPSRAGSGRVGSGKAKFCLLVMTLLVGGLAMTLWLSTAAASDSYRLESARSQARELTVQDERLRAEVAAMQTAPALAETAKALGMVPSGDVARLVVAPDGNVVVVGNPRAVAAPAPPPAPAAPPPAAEVAAPGAPAAQPPGAPAPAPGQPAAPQAPAGLAAGAG